MDLIAKLLEKLELNCKMLNQLLEGLIYTNDHQVGINDHEVGTNDHHLDTRRLPRGQPRETSAISVLKRVITSKTAPLTANWPALRMASWSMN